MTLDTAELVFSVGMKMNAPLEHITAQATETASTLKALLNAPAKKVLLAMAFNALILMSAKTRAQNVQKIVNASTQSDHSHASVIMDSLETASFVMT